MKKYLFLFLAILLTQCTFLDLPSKVANLEIRISQLEKDVILIREDVYKQLQERLMSMSEEVGADSKFTIFPAYGLTGGGNAVDGIDGDHAKLDDGDACFSFVLTGTTPKFYVYLMDTDNGGTEDGTTIITPDTNAGNKRWILCYIHTVGLVGEGSGDKYIKVINSGNPGSLEEGMFWYDSGSQQFEYYDGTNVYTIDSTSQ